jgi:LacI family transcriptional regulator
MRRSPEARYAPAPGREAAQKSAVRATSTPPTIIDVALEAGLSKSTVSRALNGSGSVSAEARRRAEEAARRLDYTPNELARSMIRGSTKLIGVIVPDAATPYFARAIRGISDVARASGFEVVLANTDGDVEAERRALSVLIERRSDGVIVAPASVTDGAPLARAIDAGTPIVQLDRCVAGLSGGGSVTIDNAGIAYIAVRHFLDLGHRKIAVITETTAQVDQLSRRRIPRAGFMPSAARLAGYLRALEEYGVDCDPELIVRSKYRREAALAATQELLAQRQDATAVFCTDGVMTSGAFEAIQRSDLPCPSEISLIGFDDQEWTTMVRPEITIVEQPDYELGMAAARQLLARIANPGRRPRDVRLRARLVVRGSTSFASAKRSTRSATL